MILWRVINNRVHFKMLCFNSCCVYLVLSQMWNRVLTVQLFLKRVCLPKTTEASLVDRKCKRLFTVCRVTISSFSDLVADDFHLDGAI